MVDPRCAWSFKGSDWTTELHFIHKESMQVLAAFAMLGLVEECQPTASKAGIQLPSGLLLVRIGVPAYVG